MRRFVRLGSPGLVVLEDRVTPIIGQVAVPGIAGEFTAAPRVQPGAGHDGVVHILAPSGKYGTGTLFLTDVERGRQHFVLTAAHVIDESTAVVNFDMPYPGRPDGIRIPVNVPAGNDYLIRHPLAQPRFAASTNEYDIGLVRLTDQEPGQASPDKLLVAPYSPDSPYTLHRSTDEIGRIVRVLGYGQGLRI